MSLILIFACQGNPKSETLNNGDSNTNNSASSLVINAHPDMVTAATAEWTTSNPTQGHIRLIRANGRSIDFPLESEATETHSATIYGMTADEDVQIQYIVDNVALIESEWSSSTFPPNLPLVNSELSTEADYHIVAPLIPPESSDALPYLTVIGPDDDIVWYKELSFFPTSTIESVDGKGVWTISDMSLHYYAYDLSEELELPAERAHHDLTVVDAETIAYLQLNEVNINGKMIQADAIVECTSNGETVIWSVTDSLEELGISDADIQSAPDMLDLAHTNSIEYVASEDAYYINMTAIRGVAKIDRSSQSLTWAYRADTDLATLLNAPEQPDITHKVASISPDRFYQFVNLTIESNCSRIAEVTLEGDEALLEWVVAPSECRTVFALGGVDPLAEDKLLVFWSTMGQIEEWEGGSARRRLQNDFGYGWGYGYGTSRFFD